MIRTTCHIYLFKMKQLFRLPHCYLKGAKDQLFKILFTTFVQVAYLQNTCTFTFVNFLP